MQARLTQTKLASDSQLSFIGSTAITFISLTALINVRLIRWLGTKKACVLGCVFLGLGPVLNGFTVQSYGGLLVTNGVVLGFGTSLTFMVSIAFRKFSIGRRSPDKVLSLNIGLQFSSVSIFQATAWHCQWTDIRREWAWRERHQHLVEFTHRPSRDPLGIQDSRVGHLGRDDTGRVTTQGTNAKGPSLRRMVRTMSLLSWSMDCHSSGPHTSLKGTLS